MKKRQIRELRVKQRKRQTRELSEREEMGKS